MSFFLIIDAEHLARRAWYSTGGLSYRGSGTGIAYGIIREAASLIGFYQPYATAWCFDSRKSFRKKMYPKYKSNRITTNDDREAMFREIKYLRTEHLPAMGFRNIFVKPGFEADDIIATLAYGVHFADQAMIVSSDKDLYQCLSTGVCIYNPITKKKYTIDDFKAEYGIHPSTWSQDKAPAAVRIASRGLKALGRRPRSNGYLESWKARKLA
jgi:5'-3' exonuclease